MYNKTLRDTTQKTWNQKTTHRMHSQISLFNNEMKLYICISAELEK